MFRIMSYSAFILVILSFLCPITLQKTLPPKAVNAERIQLLKDALSWMTFRKNGELASDKDLEPFFGALEDRYLTRKFYKTLIIAFTKGVLSKLTLKENDRCDPAYTLEYKDSHNNSVTDGKLREFIFESYDNRWYSNRQFCDYREGLICNQQTSKCECPVGSKMEPISQGSAIKRCLLQENEVCALLDLDHDPDSNYGALKNHLPEMIFNLEKPLSCKMGTQCRFKSTAETTPLCYEVNNGPWVKGRWGLDIGEECTLGLYGDTGSCLGREDWDREQILAYNFGGYTCFNFGPRSQTKSPYVGFCAHHVGSYGISDLHSGVGQIDKVKHWDLQMIGFVSPATTPLRGKRLFDYYDEYLIHVENHFDNLFTDVNSMSPNAGDKCNIEKTEKLLELWKFFYGLEKNPPQGQDYVATETQLWAKLKEARSLANTDLLKRMCRVNTMMFSNSTIAHALRCVRDATTDKWGNDGTCRVIRQIEDVTYKWAKSFLEYRKHLRKIEAADNYKRWDYRKDIYEPELECDPKLGPPPGSQGAAPSTDTDVLEGGYCPPDRVCYEDYGQNQDIYDNFCRLKDAKPRLFRNCQDLSENRGYDGCEGKHLDNLLKEELKTVSSSSGLKRGDACKHEIESKLRNWRKSDLGKLEGNKYQRLIDFYEFNKEIGGKGLCDRTKLLECSGRGTCGCFPDFKRREVNVQGSGTIFSDYCYITSGKCDLFDPRFKFSEQSNLEAIEIEKHYHSRKDEGGTLYNPSCEATNWCVFTKEESDDDDDDKPGKQVCTAENTGHTGHNGEDPTTTTRATTTTTVRSTRRTTTAITRRTTTRHRKTTTDKDESDLMCKGDDCGWQDAGEAQKEIHVFVKMMIVIKMFANCV